MEQPNQPKCHGLSCTSDGQTAHSAECLAEHEAHASGTAQRPIPAKQPAETAALLDSLPGMVGALDRAIFDQTGKKMPFVLLIFNNGGAMHATNIHPPIDAVAAVKELAKAWDDMLPEEHGGGDAAG